MLKVIGGTPAFSLLPPFTSSADVLASSGENPMKIVVLTGSPHRQGTSDLLADEFIAGATSKGHTIVRFDTALRKSVHAEPALTATSITGECIQKDAMRKILPEILGLLSYFIWYCGPYARAYALLCREKSSRNGQPPGQGILLPVEDIGGAWSAWRRAGETYRLSASRSRRTLAGGFVYCLWTARRMCQAVQIVTLPVGVTVVMSCADAMLLLFTPDASPAGYD